MKDHLSATG
jgi:hypothetical protein